MVSFEIFVKAMPPSLLELKVLPSFCYAFKIPDNVTASILYEGMLLVFSLALLAVQLEFVQRKLANFQIV